MNKLPEELKCIIIVFTLIGGFIYGGVILNHYLDLINLKAKMECVEKIGKDRSFDDIKYSRVCDV